MNWNRTLCVCALALATTLAAVGQIRHAKVVLEGGTPLPTTPMITPAQSARLIPACRIYNIFGNGTIEYAVDWRSRPYDPSTADVCPVTIRLAGYRQTEATLRDGAVITLKRVGDHEGSTVSMTALKAPEDARKAYNKGVQAISSRKWPAAQKNLERAVEIYPGYAAAWSDLGEVLREQSNAKEARTAYERAIQEDPKYIKPYLQLARMDLAEGRMEDAAKTTDQALALNPIEFPGIYFYNAVANFNLKRLDSAERSARRAVELDTEHEVPRSEYVLGTVLTAKGDRRGALEHMRKYLEISPKAADAAEVKGRIAALESGVAPPQ